MTEAELRIGHKENIIRGLKIVISKWEIMTVVLLKANIEIITWVVLMTVGNNLIIASMFHNFIK